MSNQKFQSIFVLLGLTAFMHLIRINAFFHASIGFSPHSPVWTSPRFISFCFTADVSITAFSDVGTPNAVFVGGEAVTVSFSLTMQTDIAINAVTGKIKMYFRNIHQFQALISGVIFEIVG